MTSRSFPLYDVCNIVVQYDWTTTLYNIRYLSPAANMNMMCLIAHYCHLHNMKVEYTFNVATNMSSILSEQIPTDLRQILSNYVTMCLSP